MDKLRNSIKNKKLACIANHLIINASFMSDLGLYRGKMGVVLFFYHYARYSGKSVYSDFGGELLREIYQEIHSEMPINFVFGLCGIGWGIEYLLQNDFIKGDSNDVLEDVDRKIMEKDVLRMKDNSFETGLAGISVYVDSRLKGNSLNSSNKKTLTFDNGYLDNLLKIEPQIKKAKPKDVLSEILKDSPDSEDIHNIMFGLRKGCAGVGLKMILQ